MALRAQAASRTQAHISRIRQYDTRQLWELFERLRAGERLSQWPDGKAFELLILRAFDLEGALVTWPYSVYHEGKELEQVDGSVRDGDLFCLLESKHWSQSVDFGTIAMLKSKLSRRPSFTMGAIFSMKGFTKPAKVLAQFSTPINILLWEAGDIEYGLKGKHMREGLQKKVHHAVEHGFPDHSLSVEVRS
jgi:hypothetical protein